ncbi:Sterol desaturase [Actinokineospora spheciospongiae]|uniref:Sterol desaturase n=1 Tax=Actinokineospora spheciospongiae TaxID=909613 RepID=W7ILR9_9PSEU|nr:sterol desaturase family protein [Actinokineospora spheciospongiae]EWC61845.1 Sterol desaturase [Actinokineospora spheciospongiae]PWW63312.1 sterol desaturase/sphingolipid hydroxylase (fatty acid hydroxylase superfamily) [Actinokineospora spheciospongiae]
MVDSLSRRGTSPHPVLRRIAYPALLLATLTTAVVAIAEDWDPGVVSPLAAFTIIAVFALLEHLIPFEPRWRPRPREWGVYALYFLFTALGTALAQTLVAAVVEAIAPLEPGWPLALELPTALLLGSLGGYAFHRFSHRNPFLWRFHGVHHVPDKVNVGNNGVNHVLDITMTQVVVQLSLALVGFSAQSVFAVGLFVVLQGYFTHANIDVGIGWLNHVLASPEQHRLHHSTDLAEAGHYGSDLSVWDHLFGSYTWRPGRTPAAIGLSDPTSFPRTGEVVASFLHPLRPRGRAPRPGG